MSCLVLHNVLPSCPTSCTHALPPMLVDPEPCRRATLPPCHPPPPPLSLLQSERTIDRYHSFKRKVRNCFVPSSMLAKCGANAVSQKAMDVASAAAAAMQPMHQQPRERVLKIKDNRIDEGMLAIILDRRLAAAEVGSKRVVISARAGC